VAAHPFSQKLHKARHPQWQITFASSLDETCQSFDSRPDVGSEQPESGDCRNGYERCRNGVFRQLKPGFISQEFHNHDRSPYLKGSSLPATGSKANWLPVFFLELSSGNRVREFVDLDSDVVA
jgi:hypothetical protein